jgi:NADPH-dependent 2,4-dienoyl-CoA reductase/sulfur reductase-like enzyme
MSNPRICPVFILVILQQPACKVNALLAAAVIGVNHFEPEQEGLQMAEQPYDYIIIGAGLAGAMAIDGIRERDDEGSIFLIGKEQHLPYDRPPLSKKLWFGQKKVEDIFVKDQGFMMVANIDTLFGVEVATIEPRKHLIADSRGDIYRYNKLLIATGGEPRQLDIHGADLEGICYYRTLDDYKATRAKASEGKSAVVIGGGFIGSELAAALNINKVDVTMVFPDPYLLQRILPESLARAIQQDYVNRGVKVLSEDTPVAFEKRGERFVTKTKAGKEIESDIVIVGIGIRPSSELAERAGLKIENGIDVNELLQTSDKDVYAAGDNAYFPYKALGKKTRVEHWDNALNQGAHAGRNMAGANQPFTYMSYFFSDLFDFGFEAVGEVDSRLETFADWQEENRTGVVYYLKDERVRGAMMCNVWDHVDAARQMIKRGKKVAPEDLRGAIK